MGKPTSAMTIQIPEDVKGRLDRLAETTERSSSLLAVDAIDQYVRLQEWQLKQIDEGIRQADAGIFASDEEVAAVFAKFSDARPMDP